MTARILCIGGSDPSGGAGIQADIKTITMLGGYAMTAITALTVQNTLGVSAVYLTAPEAVVVQMEAVISDIGVDAIKIGMIGSAQIAAAVANFLLPLRARQPDLPIIFDPVMMATSGASLADSDTVGSFARLMKIATLITPNLPELEALGGEESLRATGAHILVKGGHGSGDVLTDRLIGPAGEIAHWSASRIDTCHTHGTGCTLASAIACGLAQDLALETAIERARAFVRAALLAVPELGQGSGPMGHHAVRLQF